MLTDFGIRNAQEQVAGSDTDHADGHLLASFYGNVDIQSGGARG